MTNASEGSMAISKIAMDPDNGWDSKARRLKSDGIWVI